METASHEDYLKVAVRATSDDAEERRSGTIIVGEGAHDLDFSEAGKKIGLRFTDLDIPKDATITKAYLGFRVASSGSGDTVLTVRAEDSDTPRRFTRSERDISSRRTTTAAASWRPSAWRKDASMRSSDVSKVVQEVVSRSDWNSGDALAFIVTGDSRAKRSALSRNGGGARYAPTLRVWYEVGAKPQPSPERGVRVILDTDLGIDVDDAGALAVLHALADRGEARILATVANVNDPYRPRRARRHQHLLRSSGHPGRQKTRGSSIRSLPLGGASTRHALSRTSPSSFQTIPRQATSKAPSRSTARRSRPNRTGA